MYTLCTYFFPHQVGTTGSHSPQKPSSLMTAVFKFCDTGPGSPARDLQISTSLKAQVHPLKGTL